MTIGFPRDLPQQLHDFLVGMSFPPSPTNEVTPLRSGKVISHDLGPTLWQPKFQSVSLPEHLAGFVLAWHDTVLSTGEFFGFDKRREYPLAYAGGWGGLTVGGSPFSGNCRLTAVAGNNVEVSLDQLPAGFIFSTADWLAFDYLSGAARALHRVSAGAVANGDGIVTLEVRPHVRPGFALNASVMLYRAAARMLVLPGTYSEQADTNGTTISFEAIQTL